MDCGKVVGPAASGAGPANTTEVRLARLWSEVLGVVSIRGEDDFLDLGGDSLGLTRLAQRIRREFGVGPSLGTLFELTTLQAQAAWLSAAKAGPAGNLGEADPGRTMGAGAPAVTWPTLQEPIETDPGRTPGAGAQVPESAPPTIPGTLSPDRWPLSHSQERFWIQARLEPDSRSANIPTFLRFIGPLDPLALERALGAVWRRHPVLRAVFLTGPDGQPIQVIREWTPLALPTVDVSGLPPLERATRIGELARAATHAAFDLENGPLWRMELVRLAPAEHLLLLTIHHLVFDAWSKAVLVGELARELAGLTPPGSSAKPPVSYVDHAAEQRRAVEAGEFGKDFEYWRQALAGPLPLLEMPILKPPSVPGSGIGAQELLQLSQGRCAVLDAFCRREGVTRFATLLAAYAALLRRAGASQEIVVGCPVAGRTHPGTETLIGCFINVVALRLRIPLDASFRQLVQAVRAVVIDALAHQAAPFHQVLQRIAAPRPAHRTPVFQTLFNLRNVPVAAAVMGDALRIEPWRAPNDLAQIELELNLEPTDGGLSGLFQYDSGLLAAGDVARLRDGLRQLLEGALEDPDVAVGRLAVPALAGMEGAGAEDAVARRATPDEARWLLEEWNRPPVPGPVGETLAELVSRQATRDPDGIALEDGRQRLTRRELEDRSDVLARHLRRWGVGPESRVGLCLERSPELVVGMLGILKAGGAYVPLDPAYPRDRLQFMLADSRPVAVVTTRALAGRLSGDAIRPVYVDDPSGWEDGPVAGDGWLPPGPGNAAYVIYTSGSTGQPKGVVVEQAAVVNYVTAAAARFGLDPGDRVLQFSSPSFDASVEEIFGTLVAGATVVFRDDAMLFTPAGFLRACGDRRITVLDLPTAYWNELGAALEEGGLTVPATVRLVVFGGERALPSRLRAWRRVAGPSVRLLNAYGPTEATVSATWCDVGAGAAAAESGEEVPIGRPIPNLRAYVVDASLALVAPGEVGELALAGVGLARGYLHQPGLTAEKFAPDPFQPGPGGRLYRTGDRVRIRPDGELVYLGRVDDQMKVRGFRIEPGEVESMLARVPGVREAMVGSNPHLNLPRSWWRMWLPEARWLRRR